jgi:hypothetical protein
MVTETDLQRLERAVTELEEIANLPSVLDDAFFFVERKRDYSAFWTKAKEVSDVFRAARVPHEARQRLWTKHHRICESVKELQARDWESRRNRSAQNADRIENLIKEARPLSKWGEDLDSLRQANKFLDEARELLKNEFFLPKDRQACWTAWNEVKDQIRNRRTEIFGRNYDAIRSEIGDISNPAHYGDAYDALRMIQALQERIRDAELTKDQRQWLRAELEPMWTTAQSRLHRRREERAQRREEWRQRQESSRDRFQEILDRKEDAANRLRERITELEEKIGSAWNDDWAERAQDKLDQLQGYLEETERDIRNIEEKIADINEKLRQED